MALTLRHVETDYVQQVWPFVEPYIRSAMERGGDFPEWAHSYNIEHIQVFLTTGQWLLVVMVDEQNQIHGCCTVSFINYPLHRVAFVTTIGGRLIFSKDTVEQFRIMMKQRGATKVQCYGRPSVVRLWRRYNFEPRNALVEMLL